MKKGQSVIEIIIAVTLLVIIASGSVIAVLGSFMTIRLAEEETRATLINVEGIEAVKSIRDQSWDNLVNGSHGLSNSGGFWSFSETSDIDSSGRFTRAAVVSDVSRDTSGNIVETGGTIDPHTKKVTATVSWSFTPSRQNSVVITSLLTNWQEGMYVMPGSSSGCGNYCISIGYTGGMCRRGVSECLANGEVNQSKGNRYCNNEPLGATCCCQP